MSEATNEPERRYLIDQRGIAPPKEAAFYAHSTGATLAVWRHQGRGPRFIKRGHRIFYSFAEIDRWLRAQPVFSSTPNTRATRSRVLLLLREAGPLLATRLPPKSARCRNPLPERRREQ